jgi:hypothetical protein
MAEPCKLLAQARIDIRTLTLADTERFGILRLIVSDWQRCRDLLEEAGYLVNITEVVAVEIADRPGSLCQLLALFEDTDINVEYMYGFTFGGEGRAALVFRFNRPDAAIDLLRSAGLNVLEDVEVYHRIAK